MHPIRKWFYKTLSGVNLDITRDYRQVRRLQHLSKPVFMPLYRAYDYAVKAEDGYEIPIRIFLPQSEATALPECPDPAAPGPKAADSAAVLLFFHGGGWVIGDIDTYTAICQQISDVTGSTVVSVDYRLAPEHPFPAGLSDCYAVALELFTHPEHLQTTARQITLMGDSAGGNLAAAVALLARQRGSFAPTRQILLYPATDADFSDRSPFPSMKENGQDYLLTTDMLRGYMDLYVPDPARRSDPLVSPLRAPELSGQPQTLIVTAQLDPLRDAGEAYGRRLAQAGCGCAVYRLHDAIHGFMTHGQPAAPYIDQTFLLLTSFLDTHTRLAAEDRQLAEEVLCEERLNTLSIHPEGVISSADLARYPGNGKLTAADEGESS
ncbi:MAG: alpha/beta hydrolase [Oscillospiraceae bacterium]|nr:alpha/beta hydrolase [Oscillospiraceae bacterium]MDD4368380.1 alpha/beta hydrolase [Oscillospiraceae bacterium]